MSTGGYLPEDLVLAARREENVWVLSQCVCGVVPMQECKDAGKKLLDLIWVDTDKSVDLRSQEKTIETLPGNTSRRGKAKFNEPYLFFQLFSSMPPLEAVKALVQHDITSAHFQGTAQRVKKLCLPAEDKQTYGEDTFGRLIESMCATQDASHNF